MISSPKSPLKTSEEAVLPFSFAKKFSVVVTQIAADKVVVSYCDPDNLPAQEICRYLDRPVIFTEVNRPQFEAVFQQIYEEGASDALAIADDIKEDLDLKSIAQQLPEPADLLENKDDAPIIRLINGFLTEAIKRNASDIHLEPFENSLQVRFRIDGVLREILSPPKVLAPLLVSRIKVMARLDIAEKRLPQDGRISLMVAGRAVDVRVSTIPAGLGERVVLRLLDKQAGRLDFSHLGIAAPDLEKIDRIIHKPHGIVLVTGPTGSGKTTTLYAVLSRLNKKSRNIMTVEDPIEYYLEGISQTQVMPKVEMTFAKGLRAILRQDPDVVMIGEIRDLETAKIAVQASLTGHLVFSTLHTNTAVGAITRLRDMGIEPFLLSSTLRAVIAQRLVRLLCPHCKKPYELSVSDLQSLAAKADVTAAQLAYGAVGCERCHFQGYRKRTGIYELLLIDDRFKEFIHNGAGERQLEAYARKVAPGIRDDGLRRILEADTTISEIVRVTQDDLREQ